MIIPSIDLQGGQTVQLIGGEELEIEAGDPIPIARKFRLAGEIAVIDLDAAMGDLKACQSWKRWRRRPCGPRP